MENQSLNEFKEVVVSLQEAQSRGYEIADTYNEKTNIFFVPACEPNPEYVKYIKQQWDIVGHENEKDKNDRKAIVLLGNGSFLFGCGDWVVNTDNAKNNYVMVLFDGVNKPIVIEGMVDSLEIAVACKQQWPTSPDEVEAIKQQYLLFDGGSKEEDKDRIEAESIIDNATYKDTEVSTFFSDWNDTQEGIEWLYNFVSDSTYAVNVVNVYKAVLAEKMGNWRTVRYLANKLKQVFPKDRDYWIKQEELADTKIKEEENELLEKGFDREGMKKSLYNEVVKTLEELNNKEQEEEDTPFHTLVFDCNAVYGDVLVSLDTLANYETTIKGVECEKDKLSYRYSAAEFDYINSCKVNLIDFVKMNKCFNDMNKGIEVFMELATEVLLEVQTSEAFQKLWKTDDFNMMCMDHGEYKKSLLRKKIIAEYSGIND